jgi:hypothetical protein
VAGPLTARLAAPLTYLVLAVLGHLPAFRSLTETTMCRCRDAPQHDWFLGWTPFAVGSGRSPWFSQHLVAPEGLNLMWNTALPLPALLAWPVTATAGVLASHTLLAVLSFAGSADRRCGCWPGGSSTGAGRASRPACSTASARTSSRRAPVTSTCRWSCCRRWCCCSRTSSTCRQSRRAVLTGALLGVVAMAQLLTTEEVLASTFVMGIVGTASWRCSTATSCARACGTRWSDWAPPPAC